MAQTALQSAFQKFVKFCRAVTEGDKEVIHLIEKRYAKTNESFVSSNEFGSLLLSTTEKISKDLPNKYVYLKEFVTELKAYGTKPVKPIKRKQISDNEGNEDEKDASASKKIKLSDTATTDESTVTRTADKSSDSVSPNHSDCEIIGDDRDAGRPEDAKPASKHFTRECSIPTSANTSENELIILNNRKEVSTNNQAQADNDKTSVSPSQSFAVGLGLSPAKAAPEQVKRRLPLNEIKGDSEKTTHPAFHQSLLDRAECSRQLATENARAGKGDKRMLDTGSESERDGHRGSEKQIRRLEILLGEISKEIERLETVEISLDDLDNEDCTYTLIDRYKKKFVKVWEKLCDTKRRDTNTGRVVERKFKFEGTRYPEINRKIEKFINKHRIFPDFQDIRNIVCLCNRKHHLRISKNAMDMVARDAFTEVGNKLQERRQEDLVANFGCHLTDSFKSYEDPAMFDKNLRKKLEENKHVSKTNIDEVINKYAHKQMAEGDETEDEENEEELEEEEEGARDRSKSATPPGDDRVSEESVTNSEDEEIEPSARSHKSRIEDNDDDIPALYAKRRKRSNSLRRAIFAKSNDDVKVIKGTGDGDNTSDDVIFDLDTGSGTVTPEAADSNVELDVTDESATEDDLILLESSEPDDDDTSSPLKEDILPTEVSTRESPDPTSPASEDGVSVGEDTQVSLSENEDPPERGSPEPDSVVLIGDANTEETDPTSPSRPTSDTTPGPDQTRRVQNPIVIEYSESISTYSSQPVEPQEHSLASPVRAASPEPDPQNPEVIIVDSLDTESEPKIGNKKIRTSIVDYAKLLQESLCNVKKDYNWSSRASTIKNVAKDASNAWDDDPEPVVIPDVEQIEDTDSDDEENDEASPVEHGKYANRAVPAKSVERNVRDPSPAPGQSSVYIYLDNAESDGSGYGSADEASSSTKCGVPKQSSITVPGGSKESGANSSTFKELDTTSQSTHVQHLNRTSKSQKTPENNVSRKLATPEKPVGSQEANSEGLDSKLQIQISNIRSLPDDGDKSRTPKEVGVVAAVNSNEVEASTLEIYADESMEPTFQSSMSEQPVVYDLDSMETVTMATGAVEAEDSLGNQCDTQQEEASSLSITSASPEAETLCNTDKADEAEVPQSVQSLASEPDIFNPGQRCIQKGGSQHSERESQDCSQNEFLSKNECSHPNSMETEDNDGSFEPWSLSLQDEPTTMSPELGASARGDDVGTKDSTPKTPCNEPVSPSDPKLTDQASPQNQRQCAATTGNVEKVEIDKDSDQPVLEVLDESEPNGSGDDVIELSDSDGENSKSTAGDRKDSATGKKGTKSIFMDSKQEILNSIVKNALEKIISKTKPDVTPSASTESAVEANVSTVPDGEKSSISTSSNSEKSQPVKLSEDCKVVAPTSAPSMIPTYRELQKESENLVSPSKLRLSTDAVLKATFALKASLQSLGKPVLPSDGHIQDADINAEGSLRPPSTVTVGDIVNSDKGLARLAESDCDMDMECDTIDSDGSVAPLAKRDPAPGSSTVAPPVGDTSRQSMKATCARSPSIVVTLPRSSPPCGHSSVIPVSNAVTDPLVSVSSSPSSVVSTCLSPSHLSTESTITSVKAVLTSPTKALPTAEPVSDAVRSQSAARPTSMPPPHSPKAMTTDTTVTMTVETTVAMTTACATTSVMTSTPRVSPCHSPSRSTSVDLTDAQPWSEASSDADDNLLVQSGDSDEPGSALKQLSPKVSDPMNVEGCEEASITDKDVCSTGKLKDATLAQENKANDKDHTRQQGTGDTGNPQIKINAQEDRDDQEEEDDDQKEENKEPDEAEVSFEVVDGLSTEEDSPDSPCIIIEDADDIAETEAKLIGEHNQIKTPQTSANMQPAQMSKKLLPQTNKSNLRPGSSTDFNLSQNLREICGRVANKVMSEGERTQLPRQPLQAYKSPVLQGARQQRPPNVPMRTIGTLSPVKGLSQSYQGQRMQQARIPNPGNMARRNTQVNHNQQRGRPVQQINRSQGSGLLQNTSRGNAPVCRVRGPRPGTSQQPAQFVPRGVGMQPVAGRYNTPTGARGNRFQPGVGLRNAMNNLRVRTQGVQRAQMTSGNRVAPTQQPRVTSAPNITGMYKNNNLSPRYKFRPGITGYQQNVSPSRSGAISRSGFQQNVSPGRSGAISRSGFQQNVSPSRSGAISRSGFQQNVSPSRSGNISRSGFQQNVSTSRSGNISRSNTQSFQQNSRVISRRQVGRQVTTTNMSPRQGPSQSQGSKSLGKFNRLKGRKSSDVIVLSDSD